MKQNKFDQMVFLEDDLCDLLMKGHGVFDLNGITVDPPINTSTWPNCIDLKPNFSLPHTDDCSPQEFHKKQQGNWHMPEEYKRLDIADYVLNLCGTQEELQRCGQELLLYQERDLFDLLRYLKYLVDLMTANKIIWGVGRGSSVASYVLYKLGIHRIDSLYYNLDAREFLR